MRTIIVVILFAALLASNLASDETGDAGLHVAAIRGDEAAVRTLIEAGINVNARLEPDSWGGQETPLHLAATEGHADVVRLLIEAGANLDARTKGGEETALYL